MKLSLSRSISATTSRQRLRLDLAERERVVGRAAEPDGAGATPCFRSRLPERVRRGERGLQRGVMVVHAAVDDQRRERRALVDEERRLPARARCAARRTTTRRRSTRPSIARDPERRRSALRGASSSQRGQRRVAEALEEHVAVPDAVLLVARGRRPRCGSGTSRRARAARRTRRSASRSTRARAAGRVAARTATRPVSRSTATAPDARRRVARGRPARSRAASAAERARRRRRARAAGDADDEQAPAHAAIVTDATSGRGGPRPDGRWDPRPLPRRPPGRRIDCERTMTELLEQINALISAPTRDLDADRAHADRRLRPRAVARGGEWRLEKRISEVAQSSSAATPRRRRASSQRSRTRLDGNAGELATLRRLLAELRAARERRPRRRAALSARRSRSGPRRPRPGSGSRSAASSGCSRCGS